jgi:two-component sensor histidine kinase
MDTSRQAGDLPVSRGTTRHRQSRGNYADASCTELRTMLAEKESQFYELQHRIKNSLATIAGIVGLEADHAREDATRESLERLRDRITSIAKLYDLLADAGHVRDVDIREYIHHILSTLGASHAPLRGGALFDVSCAEMSLSTRRAAPIGLIVNELVTNAIKHGLANEAHGTITVHLQKDGDLITLVVSDNGRGLPASFSLERSGGLGLQIVQMLTAQLGGRIEVVPQPATFSVTFGCEP